MDRLKVCMAIALLFATVCAAAIFLTKDSGKTMDQTNDKLLAGDAKRGEEEAAPLEKNKYEELNLLVEKYYALLSTGNSEELKSIMDTVDETTKVQAETNQRFMEGYQNIDVYTKKGTLKDSYIVFVYYDMNIWSVDTPAPGLGTLYAVRGPDGQFILSNQIHDEQIQKYVQEAAKDEAVQALIARVQEKYIQAKDSDTALKSALSNLQTVYRY